MPAKFVLKYIPGKNITGRHSGIGKTDEAQTERFFNRACIRKVTTRRRRAFAIISIQREPNAKEDIMKRYYTMRLDGNAVRFTPTGEVAIVDAIQALSGSDRAGLIWQDIRKAHPKLDSRCHGFSFRKNGSTEVVDNEGWEKIEEALINYIIDNGLPT
jgi:hypothetical protein